MTRSTPARLYQLRSKITTSPASEDVERSAGHTSATSRARRRRKRNHPEDARAHPLHHSLDRAALACPVAPVEEDADLQALVHHPLLEFDELDVQPREFPLVFPSLQLAIVCKVTVLLVGHRVTH